MVNRFIFSVFCFLSSFGFSQNYEAHTINYGVNEGLPSSECYEIIQDRQGYIWFGTDRGVVRYNGYEFRTYTTKEGLNNNVVFYLHESKDGKIWFYDLERQLSYFENDSIYLYKYNDVIKENMNPLSSSLDFYFDEEQTVHFSALNRRDVKRCLKSIDKNGKCEFYEADLCQFIFNQNEYGIDAYYGFDYGKSQNIVKNSRKLSSGEIIFRTYNICHTNGSYSTSSMITSDSKFNNFVPRFASHGDKFYFSYINELYLLEKGFPIKKIMKFSKGIIDLEINEGNVYVGLFDNGLKVLHAGNPEKISAIIDNCSASGVLFDRNGAVWVTTQDKGLFFVPNRNFKQFKASSNEVITNISGNRNEIIYSDYNGNIYNLNDGRKLKLGLSSPSYIKTILAYKDHGFIASLVSQYSYYYKSAKHPPVCLPRERQYVGVNDYNFFVAYDWHQSDSLLYGVFTSNISGYDEAFDRTYYKSFSDGVLINCLTKGFEKNELYLGRNDGLYLFSNDHLIKSNPDNPLFDSRISDLTMVKNTLYASTRGEGLIIYPKGQEPYALSKSDGLISNEIHKIHVYKEMVYVLSKEGLSIVNLSYKDPKITNYTSKNGLASNEINDIFIRNDTIWLATNKGITKFHQNRNSENELDCPIYLKSLKIKNIKRNKNELSGLNYYENDLEFSFEAVSFNSHGNIKYRYRLEGIDDKWKVTVSRELRYPNLPPGSYKFIISYQKPDLTWSSPTTLFKFKINVPFWEKLSFIIPFLTLILLLIYAVIQRFINKAKGKIDVQKKILDLERRALQAQMSPHFIFNALTSIQSLIAQNKNDHAEEFLVTFSRMVRASLNQSSQAFISLQEEIELLNNYMKIEGLRFEEVFQSNIHLSSEVVLSDISIPPMIIQPFVENAIEHGIRPLGKKGHLSIEISEIEEGFLEIKIDDDGVGRKKSEKQQIKGRESKGISLVRDRLALLNKASKVQIIDKQDNNVSCGTLVVVHVPYQRD